MDAFCDEQGKINTEHPRMSWSNVFDAQGSATTVNIEISFDKLEDLETIISMGFKEGFTLGMENLDTYISAQFYLRKQKKPNNQTRVTTYLNFPGNTEEAFLFYKSVFRTDFIGGIQRVGDVPGSVENPDLAEKVKNMVLHVELPILGGHILMGTDAPKEMGFTLVQGNNMHISLEPDSKEETERIFKQLSAGGKVDMPLQDMFWGAYFGSFTDKYGINWMLNFQTKN